MAGEGEDWWLDVKEAAVRESRSLWCKIRGHKWKPWPSPFFGEDVKMCERCKIFSSQVE